MGGTGPGNWGGEGAARRAYPPSPSQRGLEGVLKKVSQLIMGVQEKATDVLLCLFCGLHHCVSTGGS